ncbi:MAG: glycosylase [Phycisphaerales bacterium]|nr:glycosylase [Phycisphaerales bacterium]
MTPFKPTPEQLAAVVAAGTLLPDVIAPGLRVLFCGINPSLYSAAVGHHFARPGNRFWPALHAGGFTPRRFSPWEDADLPALGVGITNIAPRPTARADELSVDELAAGAEALARKCGRHRPRVLAVLGISAYRLALARPGAVLGPQPDRMSGAVVWVLPNPSGLNAHFQPPRLAELFAELRAAAEKIA